MGKNAVDATKRPDASVLQEAKGWRQREGGKKALYKYANEHMEKCQKKTTSHNWTERPYRPYLNGLMEKRNGSYSAHSKKPKKKEKGLSSGEAEIEC